MCRTGVGLMFTALIAIALAGCQGKTFALKSADMQGQATETVSARLWEPESTGRFPAVVLLHGCAGGDGDNIERWARWFVARGYVAMAVYSLGPRGVSNICTLDGNVGEVSRLQRGRDAYGALEFLSGRPNVDPSRVLAMGWSDGGSTVLSVLSNDFHDFIVPDSPKFRAGIALYPLCRALNVERYAPMIIIIGAADDYTYPELCEPAPSYLSGGRPIELLIIPGAHHAFDVFAGEEGKVGPRGYLRYTLIPSRSATNAAEQRVARFLQEL